MCYRCKCSNEIQLYKKEALVEAVNATVATGDGDCPELGMTGILNDLNLSNPDSNVMVLTDAAAKDINRTEEVILAAKELHNAIQFFISTPFCDDITEYLEVVNATNGIVVNTLKLLLNFLIMLQSLTLTLPLQMYLVHEEKNKQMKYA